MSHLGERVLAVWPHEVDWVYPGVIVATKENALEIQFDDGGRATVSPDQVFPFNVWPGQTVQSRWQGGDAFYTGTIASVIENAIAIDYVDGDKETTSASMLRIERDHL